MGLSTVPGTRHSLRLSARVTSSEAGCAAPSQPAPLILSPALCLFLTLVLQRLPLPTQPDTVYFLYFKEQHS